MRGQPSTRTDLFFPILLTLLTIKRLSHTGLFSLSFSSVQCSIKYNVVVVVVYDLLVCRSVFENVCEIYISDGARESLSKWLAANVYK